MDGELKGTLCFTVTEAVAFLEGVAEQASRRLEALQGSARRWMGQLAAAGIGIARVGAFSVVHQIADGRLVPILEKYIIRVTSS